MGKSWRPHRRPDMAPVVRGPATRRYRGPSKARISLPILKRLEGHRLATWATRLSSMGGRRGIGVEFDPDHRLYITHDGDEHAFSHPERIWTMLYGHHARGRSMVYEYLLDQIDFADGNRIIDVGANTGDLALAFRALGRKVIIDAFEPAPGEYRALERNLAHASAVIEGRTYQLALWDSEAEGLTFYLKPGDADSSVLPIPGAKEEVRVPSRRLDSVLDDPEIRYRLMKLEAEGVEPEVLQGAEGLLPQIDYISADLGFERGTDAQSTLPEVTNFLLSRGFEIVGFEANRVTVLFRNTHGAA